MLHVGLCSIRAPERCSGPATASPSFHLRRSAASSTTVLQILLHKCVVLAPNFPGSDPPCCKFPIQAKEHDAREKAEGEVRESLNRQRATDALYGSTSFGRQAALEAAAGEAPGLLML